MLNFESMKTEPIDKDVEDFIRQHGGNHVNLLRAWEAHPEMRDDIDALYQSMCYCIAHKRKETSKRIFGRYKVVRNALEVEMLKVALGDVPDVLS